jgi:LacI family transcriptional regulator
MTKPTQKKRKGLKRVGLVIESGLAFDRGMTQGIGDFIHETQSWLLFMDPIRRFTVEDLKAWDLDGVIVNINARHLEPVLQLKLPTVGFGAFATPEDHQLPIPIVTVDQVRIGEAAALHLIDQGFKQFGFVGHFNRNPPEWARQRYVGFSRAIERIGGTVALLEPENEHPADIRQRVDMLSRWLKRLTKPVGILGAYDGQARAVLEACTMSGIRVPQEVAVVGVDNDEWVCSLAQPTLSSVDTNLRSIGYRLAQYLDRLMSGDTEVPGLTEIEPRGVVPRGSTDLLAFFEPEVAFAIRYIREHACDPINPSDVLRITGMSNSTAYRKFRKALGRSVHDEIQRVQLEQVKRLLMTSHQTVAQVARKCGFENVRYLTKIFREQTGKTPTRFRREEANSWKPETGDWPPSSNGHS